MTKITKARKREIRADVAVYVAEKMAGHTSWLDVPGVTITEQEFVEDELLAIQTDLLNTAVRLRRPKKVTKRATAFEELQSNRIQAGSGDNGPEVTP